MEEFELNKDILQINKDGTATLNSEKLMNLFN